MHFVYMKTDAILGQRIRRLRDAFGEGQSAFGDRFGVEQATVSRWEKGQIPKRTLWSSIAEAAKVSPAEFFYGIESDEGSEKADLIRVPVVSRLAASHFDDVSYVLTEEDVERYTHERLPPGDWIAFYVVGDSMNRVAPDGSMALVNRNARELLNEQYYAVALTSGGATFKRFRSPPRRLEPDSTNGSHATIFFDSPEEIDVIGRVERIVNNLV